MLGLHHQEHVGFDKLRRARFFELFEQFVLCSFQRFVLELIFTQSPASLRIGCCLRGQSSTQRARRGLELTKAAKEIKALVFEGKSGGTRRKKKR